MGEAADARSFIERIKAAPLAIEEHERAGALARLREQAGADPQLAGLARSLADPRVAKLLAGVFSGSPYLSGLIDRDPARLQRILTRPPQASFSDLKAQLARELEGAASRAEAMRLLRVFKSEVALLTALADLAGIWPLQEVTAALTEAADAAIAGAVSFLFREAAQRGQWLARDKDGRAAPNGFVVLAMGKAGAGELNYSSDVDLIVFYDLERIELARRRRAARLFRAPDARSGAAARGAHRRRLRLPHRSADCVPTPAPPRSRCRRKRR